jgi:hypothetical protein
MAEEVYVVTCGSYSDYLIVAIYSDREAADQRVAGENGRGPYREEHRVEVYRLNERPAYAGVVWQSVWWATPAGLRAPESAHAYEAWYEGDDPGNATAVEGEDYHYEGCPFTTRYVIVRGHSKEHVEKSANDRRQRARAELLGV